MKGCSLSLIVMMSKSHLKILNFFKIEKNILHAYMKDILMS